MEAHRAHLWMSMRMEMRTGDLLICVRMCMNCTTQIFPESITEISALINNKTVCCEFSGCTKERFLPYDQLDTDYLILWAWRSQIHNRLHWIPSVAVAPDAHVSAFTSLSGYNIKLPCDQNLFIVNQKTAGSSFPKRKSILEIIWM